MSENNIGNNNLEYSSVGGGTESILEDYYDFEVENNLKEGIITEKGLITKLDYNNAFLTYKTPKRLRYLKNDGAILHMSTKYYCYYIEINNKNGNHKIKKISNYFLLGLDLETGEFDPELTETLLTKKLTYDLAQIEKKGKGKFRIDTSSINTSLINYSLAKYEITFLTHEDKEVVKTVKASDIFGSAQIKTMSSFLLKKNAKKYKRINKIYQVDFGKTTWAKLFVNSTKRKVMKPKELYDFTFKIHKAYKAKKKADFSEILDTIIETTKGNIRDTAIVLKDIINKENLNAVNAMKRLNDIDLRKGSGKINFNEVYISLVELIETAGLEGSEVFGNIAEIISREVYLKRSLKSAVTKPTVVILFLVGVMIFTLGTFSPILFQIYDGIGEPRPVVTVFANSIITFLYTKLFFVVFFVYIFFVWFRYFSTQSFYGKKVMHGIYITLPLVGGFLKRTDYEIFLNIARQLYAGSRGHEYVLPIIKTTMSNEHIKGVIHTANYNFNIHQGIAPGYTFDKFPQYIDPRIAGLLKADTVDTTEDGELDQLGNTFRLDNDEFIENMQSTINTVLMLIAAVIIILTLFGSIIPMIDLINKF